MNTSGRLGWRGRIGVIYPASGLNELEMAEFLPDGVTLHFTRVHIPLTESGAFDGGKVSYPELRRAGRELAAIDPACILWACTSENFKRGLPGEREQMAAIASVSSHKVITAASSVTAALAHLDVTRVAVGAPYTKSVVAALDGYLRQAGFTTLTQVALGLSGDSVICALLPEDTYALAKSADHKDAQAVFISCASMRIGSIIEEVEEELGKPVVTSTMAMMWNALRTAGVSSPLASRGALFNLRR
jgi:maleate cis-trans isomerase